MSSSSLRERKKQKTRWLIQEQALRLFQEQGYDQTTVDQIAAAAEISASTFFRYFKTKEDVVIEDEYDPLLFGELAQAPAELPPLAALRYAIRTGLAAVDAAELGRILERTRLSLSVPALRMRLLDSLSGQFDVLGAALAARTGRPPGDFGTRVLAGAFFGACLAALVSWVERGGAEDVRDLLDEALAQVESLTAAWPAAAGRPAAEPG
jgi:AcrR family transcriptional regulator